MTKVSSLKSLQTTLAGICFVGLVDSEDFQMVSSVTAHLVTVLLTYIEPVLLLCGWSELFDRQSMSSAMYACLQMACSSESQYADEKVCQLICKAASAFKAQ